MTEVLLLVILFVLLSPQGVMQTWGDNTISSSSLSSSSSSFLHFPPPSTTFPLPLNNNNNNGLFPTAASSQEAEEGFRRTIIRNEEIKIINRYSKKNNTFPSSSSSFSFVHLPHPPRISPIHPTKPSTSAGVASLSLLDPTAISAALLVHSAAAASASVHDSHTNLRHHHHNAHTWGPHFEENMVTNLTVTEGDNVHLDCRVGLLEDKLVSWVRRKSDQLDLLTLGTTNYSSDPRILSDFKYPNNWRLSIRNTSRNDSGVYLCQISTHPPKVLEIQLIVQAPQVFIVNSRGERITEVHYKEGSTLQLICSVNNIMSKSLNWFRNKDLLNHDVVRGGVSIKTDITNDRAKSILRVAWVTRKDGGTYLCSAPPQNASVTVHVLNGENPAELYRNVGNNNVLMDTLIWRYYLVIIFILYTRQLVC